MMTRFLAAMKGPTLGGLLGTIGVVLVYCALGLVVAAGAVGLALAALLAVETLR